MTKLFIPELGTELTLSEDWTFTVWPERRNDTLEKFVAPKNKGSFKHTWEKGTKLIVDRIYIRKGAEDFSSVTFKTIVDKKTIRFWVSLDEANKIELSDSKLEHKPEKWPDGKFEWAKATKRDSEETFDILSWQGGYINYYENTKKFKSLNWWHVNNIYQRGVNKFTRERTSLESFKTVCRKGGVSEELINKFEEKYLKNLVDPTKK